jgi:hypothetical protein
MESLDIFNKYPLESEWYNSDNFRIEKIKSHIVGKWMGSARDWFGILSVPILPDINYYKKERNKYSIWGKYGVNNKNDGNHILIAGDWPETYFVHCINSGYGVSEIYSLSDMLIDNISKNLWPIKSKIKNHILFVYGYESDEIDSPGFEIAYTPMLERQYFNSYDGHYKNNLENKEFIKVARYVHNKVEYEEE